MGNPAGKAILEGIMNLAADAGREGVPLSGMTIELPQPAWLAIYGHVRRGGWLPTAAKRIVLATTNGAVIVRRKAAGKESA